VEQAYTEENGTYKSSIKDSEARSEVTRLVKFYAKEYRKPEIRKHPDLTERPLDI
jgi:hypothetical protein